MLITLHEAKEKFLFRLANFNVMPLQINLLIEPGEGINLSMIVQWIKARFVKKWKGIHGLTDPVWRKRFFAREIKNLIEFEIAMNYIDQGPVKAGLAVNPADWKESGAFYIARGIKGLVDLTVTERQRYIKQLSPIPPLVSHLLPPSQLEHIMQYYESYAEAIEWLYKIAASIPNLYNTENIFEPTFFLHYFTGSADYYISGFDGEDTMFGKVCFTLYNPDNTEYRKFSLSNLKSNQFIQLDLTWKVPDTKLRN
jgi:REP element-mobilizing transposase RayT